MAVNRRTVMLWLLLALLQLHPGAAQSPAVLRQVLVLKEDRYGGLSVIRRHLVIG